MFEELLEILQNLLFMDIAQPIKVYTTLLNAHVVLLALAEIL